MSTPISPREQFADDLIPALSEWLRSGVDEANELIQDNKTDPTTYQLDDTTRHVSRVKCDSNGNVVIETFGGDLFLYRIIIQEL